MKGRRFRSVFACFWLGLFLSGVIVFESVKTVRPQPASQRDFDRWIANMRDRVLKKGISSSVVETYLSDLEPDTKVLKNASDQAEFTTPYTEYKGYFVTPSMVRKGRELKREYRSVLRKLEGRYGVPAEILLAIWGIESRYGEEPSQYDAVRALVTMAYRSDSRTNYFTGELIAVLEMIDEGQIRSEELRSSWAGALGQPQFMPSSYRTYAVDFDDDGRRDIWDTPADVLASIANYLDRNGWEPSKRWGRRLEDGDTVVGASTYVPRGTSERYLRLSNFSVLLSYNQSKFYALTVGLLSEEIGGL